MAERNTVARPYAEAGFSVARDQNEIKAWQKHLALANQILADDAAANFLDHPGLTTAQIKTLATAANDNPPKDFLNFIEVLITNQRVKLLPEIAQQFATLADQSQDVRAAQVTSAYPLSEQELDALTTTLEKHFGSQLRVTVDVDASLIGGVRAQVGDEVFDASIRARLGKLASKLTN